MIPFIASPSEQAHQGLLNVCEIVSSAAAIDGQSHPSIWNNSELFFLFSRSAPTIQRDCPTMSSGGEFTPGEQRDVLAGGAVSALPHIACVAAPQRRSAAVHHECLQVAAALHLHEVHDVSLKRGDELRNLL